VASFKVIWTLSVVAHRTGASILNWNVMHGLTRVLLIVGALAIGTATQAQTERAAWEALRNGAILVLRHASAPGGGDPPGMTLGDCRTQRNLDAGGREQALRIGERLRREKVAVGAVWSSQWCRTRETAELMQLGPVREVPAFNSFFGERSAEPAQTAAARELLRAWRGPGALVVSSHQLNISALTGLPTASGEGIVLRRDGEHLEVVGRLQP
jgi:phosphohistidine phosphatase SixA